MSTATALLNSALGVAYLCIGTMAVYDLVRGWRSLGPSHFGLAFIGLAFTCGPHHLDHGMHVLVGDRTGGGLDLVAVVVGLPAGAAFLSLRVEAVRGGAGDRFIAGTPPWVAATPTLAAVYLTAMVAGALAVASGSTLEATSQVAPNVLLVAVYTAIGVVLMRTQLRNRRASGGWSLSGLALMAVFPTCAVMHATWVLYGVTGVYAFDSHGSVIDWLSVPAGLYFLAVVRALYRDSIRDWNAASVPAAAGARAAS